MDEVAIMGLVNSGRRRLYAERLRPFGITLQQYYLIRLARWRGPIAPSFAARELDFDRPTASVVARNCIEKGWLARRRSDVDRRSNRLELSGAGEELLDRIEAARPFALESTGDPLDVLDSVERAEFRRMLDKVHRRASDIYGGR